MRFPIAHRSSFALFLVLASLSHCLEKEQNLVAIQTNLESKSKDSGSTTVETDIDESTKSVLKNMLTYLVDLIGVNEDIIEQLSTDKSTMEAIVSQEIESWSSLVNVANNLYNLDMELYESYESQLEELSASSLAYEEELDEIEVEIERVTGDLESANNNYLKYLLMADEAQQELNKLDSVIQEYLGVSGKTQMTQKKGTIGVSAAQIGQKNPEESQEYLNKMKSSLNKIKSFSSLFNNQESDQLEKISTKLLESSSKSQVEELSSIVSSMLEDMEVTSTVWESYQIQMMEATNTYDDDLGDWDSYIDSALATISETEETITTMINELETYMASSEDIKSQAESILVLLKQFETGQNEFYSTEFARLQEEIVTIQKIYDIFAVEVYGSEE